MRQIKFRAFDKENKVMSEPFSLEQIWSPSFSSEHAVYGWGTFNPFELQMWVGESDKHPANIKFEDYEPMQFTGLTDKNGKEIYEGDIIVESDFINDRSMFTVVEYGHFDNDYEDIFGFKITSFFESEKVEVIGNIYENPELLTK
jgi:uncharacterized phage protein (TIGR01671 family)